MILVLILLFNHTVKMGLKQQQQKIYTTYFIRLYSGSHEECDQTSLTKHYTIILYLNPYFKDVLCFHGLVSN